MRRVKNGDWVKIHYVCTLENGEVVDSSERFPPVEVQVSEVFDRNGFTGAIIGMAINEEKEFILLPEQTFGYPVEGKTQEIPLSKISTEVEPTVGRVMLLSFMCGSKLPGTVIEVREDRIVVDFNHPLAGKKLKYKVRLLDINDRQTGMVSCGTPGAAFFTGNQ
jgi:FKBP-type peptidyl-prolyl cis-trans isomerase 2